MTEENIESLLPWSDSILEYVKNPTNSKEVDM